MVVGGGAPGLDLRRAAPGPPPQRRLPAAPPNESTIWSEEEARQVCASAVLLQVHLYSAGVLLFPPSPPFLVCVRIPPPLRRGDLSSTAIYRLLPSIHQCGFPVIPAANSIPIDATPPSKLRDAALLPAPCLAWLLIKC